MSEWLAVIYFQDRLFGVHWHFWKVVGWVGNCVFFARFFVQWWATEKHKKVVVPNSFWWLSLIGSLMLLAYGMWRKDSVFIFAYLFTWIPYVRNLVISHRVEKNRPVCHECNTHCPLQAKFCPMCGLRLETAASAA